MKKSPLFLHYHREKITVLTGLFMLAFALLIVRCIDLCCIRDDYYREKARELHERERAVKAERGRILDRNGIVLADNKTVCTVSVIHSQIEDPERVIEVLCGELQLPEEKIRKKVEKNTALEIIKTNVEKETADAIRAYELGGVKIDEDARRYYPFGNLASKVLGFTGSDNQGIIGLEVKYDQRLKGTDGIIYTLTDAYGQEPEGAYERRQDPIPGEDIYTTIDYNIQCYAQQLAERTMLERKAERVSIMVMNPQNGEILALADVPEFDLNNPFTLTEYWELKEGEQSDLLNEMWRNHAVSDTYEPGSISKIITASAALEAGTVTCESTFYCPGYCVVEDRRIRCHKTTGHGSQDFIHATMNSCNPAFVNVGLSLGPERYYSYFEQFGMLQKTGIDLPGEATTIMHKPEALKPVELATVSFGQSYQATPIRMLTTVSGIVNGGLSITPHFVEGEYTGERIVSEETSETMQMILEQVVSEGGGKLARIEGASIGGKTATSQTLPRNSGVYIASFVGFAPADNPRVIAMILIHHPVGTYYGGQIAAPVIRELFENILPYLGIMDYNIVGFSDD